MSAGAGSDPDDAGGGVSGAPGGDPTGPATGDPTGPAADSRAPGPGARLGMIWARDRTGTWFRRLLSCLGPACRCCPRVR